MSPFGEGQSAVNSASLLAVDECVPPSWYIMHLYKKIGQPSDRNFSLETESVILSVSRGGSVPEQREQHSSKIAA
jgi:hypothetical protein